MKVEVGVLQDPEDRSFIVRTQIFESDIQAGEFFLPGGTSINEAEATAKSLTRLADTDFDMLLLVPEG